MISFDNVVAAILKQRVATHATRGLLVGVSGIDGSGKGYITAQLEAHLAQHGVSSAIINVDGWLNLPHKRFDPRAPAQNFYHHGIRLEELFSKLVVPLRDHRSHHLVYDFAEETAHQYRQQTFDARNVDVVLVEGIFLFKQEYQHVFDLRLWIECSFATALVRAIERNQEGLSPACTVAAYESIYFPAQRIHFKRDNPRAAADLIYDNDLYRPELSLLAN
jgi:uridine kinase